MKIIKKLFSLISPLWIMPIIALAIVGWLLYRGYVNSGTEIVIEFNAGDKIISGKTNLEYKGIEIGKVTAVDIHPNSIDKILVTAKFAKGADVLAREGTTFWIVKPKIGLTEISGLETLVSGVYIEVRPPQITSKEEFFKKKTKLRFVGLNSAPTEKSRIQGVPFEFYASKKGSLEVGSGIYFKDVKIGQIQEIHISDDHSGIKFSAIIYDEYNKIAESPFFLWRQGILDIKFNPNLISFETSTFKSFLEGRIELGIFSFSSTAKKKRSSFKLYDSETAAQREYIHSLGGKEFTLRVTDHHKISEGGPIYYKNTVVGELGHFKLDVENDINTISAFVFPEYVKLLKDTSVFWPIFDISATLDKSNLKINVPLVKHFFSGGIEFENLERASTKLGENTYKLFSSRQDAVIELDKSMPSLVLVLKSKDRKSLEEGSSVTYRQIQVGKVTSVNLSRSSREVEIKIAIDMKYAHLIKKESRFWCTSGFRAKLGLSGLKMETESVKTLMNGGIAFATPDEKYGPAAKPMDTFKLFDEPEKDWLEWTPLLSN